MSMKNSNDTIGNRTRDLPACSSLPQPNAPPRVPELCNNVIKAASIGRLKFDVCGDNKFEGRICAGLASGNLHFNWYVRFVRYRRAIFSWGIPSRNNYGLRRWKRNLYRSSSSTHLFRHWNIFSKTPAIQAVTHSERTKLPYRRMWCRLRLVDRYQHFKETWCLHFGVGQTKEVPPKSVYPCTKLRGVTSQKTQICIVTAVRMSNLTLKALAVEKVRMSFRRISCRCRSLCWVSTCRTASDGSSASPESQYSCLQSAVYGALSDCSCLRKHKRRKGSGKTYACIILTYLLHGVESFLRS